MNLSELVLKYGLRTVLSYGVCIFICLVIVAFLSFRGFNKMMKGKEDEVIPINKIHTPERSTLDELCVQVTGSECPKFSE